MCQIMDLNSQSERGYKVNSSVVVVFQVHQVQGVPGVTRALRGQWVRQDKRVIKETKGCQDWQDQKERKVLLDHQARQVQRVRQVLGVFQGLKDQEVLEVDLESPVIKVTLGLRGFLVGMARQGRQDYKGHRGPEEQQDLQGWMGLVGLLDPSALPGPQGCQG